MGFEKELERVLSRRKFLAGLGLTVGSVSLAKLALLQTKATELARQADQAEGVTGFGSGPGGEAGHFRLHALSDALDHSGVITDVQHGVRTLANAHGHGELSGVTANQHHAQSHVLDPGDHTISGKTDDQFLRATGATTFAFEAVIFARGGTVKSPTAENIIVWQARFPCTVTEVRGYRVGGTGATINARRNGASNHLSSALSLTSADTWMDGGAVQNTAYVSDDKLEIMIVSVTGTPTQIGIQVNLTRP